MTPPRTAAPPLPATIGRYRVKAVLGRGAQGVVYLAEDPELGREVAIKTLPKRQRDSQQLLTEARNVGRLSHPGIVPVFDVGRIGDVPYVVYERVNGRTLEDLLKAESPIPVARALLWASAVAEALDHAHQAGLVHRDLKPGNILIQEDDQPRVLDFGIALPTGTDTAMLKGLWGTVRYLSPELVGGGKVTAASDIFSLGLILHEVLTGRPAIPEEDPMAAVYHIAHRPVPPPSTLREDLEPAMDGVLARALEKDPKARFASVAEFRQALAPFLDDAPRESGDGRRQSTLNFLLRRMRKRPDFPAIGEHITDISHKTASIEGTSVDELANAILKDYALTTKLLRLVNSSFYKQYGGNITTVSRAVVILGYKQVRMAALSLLLFEHIGDRPQAAVLKELGGRALLSGVLSRRLAAQVEHADPEQSFICALLHNLGRFLAANYLADEYAEIDAQVKNKAVPEDLASTAVLGLSFEELGLGVAREWQLPKSIQDTMRRVDSADEIKPPGDARGALRYLSSLSNRLSDTLAETAPAERERALGMLLERYRAVVPIKVDTLKEAVAGGLKEVSTYAKAAGVDFRNSEFFRQAKALQQGEGANGEDTVETVAYGDADDGEATPYQGVLNGIQDISQALLDNVSLNDILVMVLETLYRGLGFTRVLLFIRNARQREMTARFGLGSRIDELLPRFRFGLERERDLFARAVKEQKDFIYNAGDRHLSELPDWYRKQCSPHTLALYPMVVNNVCLGLIYADREDGGRPITGNERNYLNTLRNQATLAVKHRT